MQPRPIALLFYTSMRGSHPLPDQLSGEHAGLHPILCSTPSNNQLQYCHTYTHSLLDRSIVAGDVLMVHMCSFICSNDIVMTAHTWLLTRKKHSGNLFYVQMTEAIVEHNRCQSHFSNCHSLSDDHPSKNWPGHGCLIQWSIMGRSNLPARLREKGF